MDTFLNVLTVVGVFLPFWITISALDSLHIIKKGKSTYGFSSASTAGWWGISV